jgi:hypothetical protein
MYVWLCRVLQLTDEERVYLNAAAMGDVPIIRQSLEEENDVVLNVNCVDYMGRSALHLAVDSENLEAIELLLDRMNFKCIEEALLHAISKVSIRDHVTSSWCVTVSRVLWRSVHLLFGKLISTIIIKVHFDTLSLWYSLKPHETL